MKKALVLAALLALAAAPALAGVANTVHNLTLGGGKTIADTTDNDQVCVYCHTPHNGNTDIGYLWNRSVALKTLALTDLYDSGSITDNSKPTATLLDEVNASDARLCLTCHDGSNLAEGSAIGSSLLNPAGGFGALQPVFAAGDDVVRAYSNIGDTAGGQDLTNDHPIGMSYSLVAAEKPANFNVDPTAIAAGIDADARIPFFTGQAAGVNDVMWCSSCHDPHVETAAFLRLNNVDSQLCTTCHIK